MINSHSQQSQYFSTAQCLPTIMVDYGTGNPAFSEETQRLLMAMLQAQVSLLSVLSFGAITPGFWAAQLGFYFLE